MSQSTSVLGLWRGGEILFGGDRGSIKGLTVLLSSSGLFVIGMRSGRLVSSCVEEPPVAVDEPLVAGGDGASADAGIEGQTIPVGEGGAGTGAGASAVMVHARVGSRSDDGA